MSLASHQAHVTDPSDDDDEVQSPPPPAETPGQGEEQEIVAVGTISHVIRRAFHQFYPSHIEHAHGDTEVISPSPSDESIATSGSTSASHLSGVASSEATSIRTEDAHVVTPGPTTLPPPTNAYVALGDSRKQLIRETLAIQQATARQFISFLEQRHGEANARDEAIAAELARQGLVVKAQIPMGPSNLRLEPQELSQFGAFSTTLVHAKELVKDYHSHRLDKSGNGPGSLARISGGIHRDSPGYLHTTSSYDVRKGTTLTTYQPYIETVKASDKAARAASITAQQQPSTTTEPSPSKASDSSVRFGGSTKDDSMPAEEKRKNAAILERMQTKLDFRRNPRYTSHPQGNDADADGLPLANSKPSFVAVPSPVEFTGYDIGGVYEQTFYVRNTSPLSRCVRVLPPGSIYFSIHQISFPDASGLIAPGMHVEVKIRFAPDSRADYKDTMTIQYEGSAGGQPAQFQLPLVARRTPPELSIPLLLRAQHTLVGSQSVTQITCKNTGGRARFWLMTEKDWNRCEATTNFRTGSVAAAFSDFLNTQSVSVGPFTLTPNEMELGAGESVPLQLTFLPSGVGELREKFVMVCDNCLVRVFQLVGRGCQIELSITGLNAQPIDTAIANMGRVSQMVFPKELLLDATATQSFSVLNETPVDLKFTWRLENDKLHRSQDKCPFVITPASGVFAQSDSKCFAVAFSPHAAGRFVHWRLVLYINDVPASSLPGPNQLVLFHETLQRMRSVAAGFSMAEPENEILRIALSGAGRLGCFHLDPPAVRIQSDDGEACDIAYDQSYQATTRVVNDCDARVTVRWDLSRAKIVQMTTTTSTAASQLFDLRVSAQEIQLGPLASETVSFCFTPLAIGAFTVAVPCNIVDPWSSSCVERWIMLEGVASPPRLCIVSPEIDFGLVLVSAKAEVALTIRNTSAFAATEWALLHVEAPPPPAPVECEGEANQRHDAVEMSPRGMRRIGSKDSIRSRHSVASSSGGGPRSSRTDHSSTGSLALFTSRDLAPRASICFTPPVGRLAPGETIDVRVVCDAGSLAERFRGTIALHPVASSLPPVFPGQGAASPNFFNRLECVSARAEIQCPNVFLTPLKLSLGTSYLGVSVDRVVELVNMSNLDAEFNFMEPQGLSKACKIDFSPKQGTLRSKETLPVRVSYTPLQAGKTTTLLACLVKGLTGPLGFEIVSTHKGLVLTYDVLALSDPLPLAPKELAKSRGVAITSGDLEPDGNPHLLPRLWFGDSIPLTQRRSLQLVVRNFSGIDAVIEMEPKTFPTAKAAAGDIVSLDGSSSLGSVHLPGFSKKKASHSSKNGNSSTTSPWTANGSPTSSKTKTKRLLSDKADASRRFQSDPGRAYLRDQDSAQQDRVLLRDGRGAAFLVSLPGQDGGVDPVATTSLRIAPWEQAVVHVTCFNNMPGNYSDILSCRAVGLPPFLLPVQATVVGSSLTLDKNCVGLHFPTARDPAMASTSPLPTFSFGYACVRSPPVTKTLRVINRGPRAAKLKWKLVEHGKENQVVQVSLRVDFAARVQLLITPVADQDESEFPFEVAPPTALVQAFSTTAFTVTFFPTATPTAARVLLVADAHWLDDPAGATTITSSSPSTAFLELSEGPSATDSSDQRWETNPPLSTPSTSTPTGPTTRRTAAGKAIQAVRVANSMSRGSPPSRSSSNNNNASMSNSTTPSCLRVSVSATVIEPELFLDQPRRGDPFSAYHIKFTTWSTLLDTWNHAFHTKQLTLVNHLNTRATFRLESTGPFAVARAESLAPKHPLASTELPPAHRRADGESFLFTLPPQMSVRIEMRFDPSRLAATSSSSSSPLVANRKQSHRLPQAQGVAEKPNDRSLQSRVEGELLVRFTNQSVQTIRLVSEILRPLVLVSPSVHSFGRVHLSQTRHVTLRIANPTVVPASFAIRHVARPQPLSRAQRQEMATYHAGFVDDPSVFAFSAMEGVVTGPTISLRSSGGAPQPATNSSKDLVAPDKDVVFAPLEIRVSFQPKTLGKRYKCRFRLVVKAGVDFEIVLDGQGHLDEVEYKDQDRPMVRTSELTHRNLILKKLSAQKTTNGG